MFLIKVFFKKPVEVDRRNKSVKQMTTATLFFRQTDIYEVQIKCILSSPSQKCFTQLLTDSPPSQLKLNISIKRPKKLFGCQWPPDLPQMVTCTCQIEKDNIQRSAQIQRSGSTHEFGQLFQTDLSNTMERHWTVEEDCYQRSSHSTGTLLQLLCAQTHVDISKLNHWERRRTSFLSSSSSSCPQFFSCALF